MTTDDYLALITSEHADKPNFTAVIAALADFFVQTVDLELGLVEDFNLDTATGVQLDAIGLWVGMSRRVPTPITGVYFTWNDTTTTGWDSGVWQGQFDPSTGLVNVDDETYRTMILAKIAANIWDGTLGNLYDVWELVFGPGVIAIQDNQDMTMTVLYDALYLNAVQINLLINGLYPLKPIGVHVTYTATGAAPIFAWNSNTPKFQGWNGTSVWV